MSSNNPPWTRGERGSGDAELIGIVTVFFLGTLVGGFFVGCESGVSPENVKRCDEACASLGGVVQYEFDDDCQCSNGVIELEDKKS